MKIRFFLLSILAIGFISLKAQNTPGTVTFTVKTVSNGGQYSPKNIVAIWVKNSSGVFIKTIKVNAQQRIQYLYKWKLSSGLNTTDAITGSTLLSHQTHTVTWNCKNVSGTVVPDGDYQFWVEFTDADVQGPYTSYTFNKGTTPVSQTFPDQSKFLNVSINYVPTASDIGYNKMGSNSVTILHPGTNSCVFQIPFLNELKNEIEIYDLSGRIVFKTRDYSVDGNNISFYWETVENESIYLYRIISGNDIYSGKVLIEK